MRICILKEVYQKVMYWVHRADFEVSGMGLVTFDGKDTFTVVDAFLPSQEGGAAHTDIDPAAMGKLMYNVHKSGREGMLNWWWHSHVKMPAFWSGQDKQTIQKFAQNGFCVATVFNQLGESRSAYSAMYENTLGVKQLFESDSIAFEVIDPSYVVNPDWEKEFADNVRERSWKTIGHWGGTPEKGSWFKYGDKWRRWDYEARDWEYYAGKGSPFVSDDDNRGNLLQTSEVDWRDGDWVPAADGLSYAVKDIKEYARVLKRPWRRLLDIYADGDLEEVTKLNQEIDLVLYTESQD